MMNEAEIRKRIAEDPEFARIVLYLIHRFEEGAEKVSVDEIIRDMGDNSFMEKFRREYEKK